METATETNSRLDRNVFGFWMLGLVNNFSWCVFASAAEDLLEGYAGVILLCMIIPGLLTKASSTFWFHLVPYNVRVGVVAIAVSSSMVAISVTNSLTTKLICLLLYSLLGAMGEMTFLSLTTYYPESVLGAWSSGTGLAGIAAAGVYYFMRQIVRLSASGTLVILSVVPLMLIVLYRFVLDQRHAHQTYSSVAEDVEDIPALKPADESTKDVAAERVLRRRLVFSFILPLGVVYFAEYTINSGTLGTFHESSFRYSRSSTTKKDTTHRLYTWLQLIYQIGVFLSRSSISYVKIRSTWSMPLLQLLNLVFLTFASIFSLLPSVSVLSAIIFWEGLLGGGTYVNTFWKLRTEFPVEHREWAMAFVCVGDTAGIAFAAMVSIWLEQFILSMQKA